VTTPAAPYAPAAKDAANANLPGANVLGDIALPAMLLKQSALDNNIAVMAQYASDYGFVLAPHGKTTMAPKLFRRQLEAGAWGITVANLAQAGVAYEAGARRVLVANEVVSRADAQAMVEALAAPDTPAPAPSLHASAAQPPQPPLTSPPGAAPGTVPSAAPAGAGRRELYCLVDSVAGVELLDRNLGGAGMADRVGVFVELGVPGGRTGARSEDEAVGVAAAVGASACLRLAGVEGYEGLLAPDRSPEALAKVDEYLDGLRRLTVRLADGGAFSPTGGFRGPSSQGPSSQGPSSQGPSSQGPSSQGPSSQGPSSQGPSSQGPGEGPILVSAGGSRFFDRVAAVLGPKAQYGGHDVRLVVRSGCYVVHDHGTYAEASPLAGPHREGPGLMAALEVWADVLSVPEPGLVIVGLGRRDVSFDLGLPVTVAVARRETGRAEPFAGLTLSQLNDQHGYLHLAGEEVPVNVGDKIGFGISHPCTAIDKWRTILLVNDDYEIVDRIPTCFH
jgi:D-serine dehydratase